MAHRYKTPQPFHVVLPPIYRGILLERQSFNAQTRNARNSRRSARAARPRAHLYKLSHTLQRRGIRKRHPSSDALTTLLTCIKPRRRSNLRNRRRRQRRPSSRRRRAVFPQRRARLWTLPYPRRSLTLQNLHPTRTHLTFVSHQTPSHHRARRPTHRPCSTHHLASIEILKFKNDRSHRRHHHHLASWFSSRARTELGVFTPPSFDATAAAPFSFAGVVDITRRRPSTVVVVVTLARASSSPRSPGDHTHTPSK